MLPLKFTALNGKHKTMFVISKFQKKEMRLAFNFTLLNHRKKSVSNQWDGMKLRHMLECIY